jgi:hypothetical protein
MPGVFAEFDSRLPFHDPYALKLPTATLVLKTHETEILSFPPRFS